MKLALRNLACICCLASCSEAPSASGGEAMLKLPKALKEISGLALHPDGALLAVADERGAIYRIDFDAAEATVHQQFGEPVEEDDFEGIAVNDGNLYVVTSRGRLLRQPLDSASPDFDEFDTGLEKICELEGLTDRGAELLLLCKTPYKKGTRKSLLIFAWSTATEELDPEPWLEASYASLDLPRLHPSGIALSPDGGALVIIAARERHLLMLTPEGVVLRHGKLKNQHVHKQAEGVVATPENTLYLADEGVEGRATVTRYEHFF